MKIKIIPTLLSVAALGVSSGAWAAGTLAGTDINNTASISYSVAGAAQVDIASAPGGNATPGTAGSPTTFVVDKKVDLNVTATSAASVNIAPNGTATHTFTLTNQGNDIEFFGLTNANDAAGDQFDTTSCTQTVTAVTGTFTPPGGAATSSVASPLQLTPDGTASVTMVCTAPVSTGGSLLVTGNVANVSLVATAVTTSGGTTALTGTAVDDPAVKDTVLADAIGTASGDGARDSKHSDKRAFTVLMSALSVAKTQSVQNMVFDTNDDGTNDTTVAGGFHIPNAVIDYAITVTNTDAEADHLVISDPIPTNMTFVPGSCVMTGDGIVNALAPDAGVAISCDINGLGTDVVSTSFTLPIGSGTATTATMTFSAKVVN